MNFKSIKHFQKLIKQIPVCFLPSDPRTIKCEDGQVGIFSPYEIDLETFGNDIKNQKVKRVKITNRVTKQVIETFAEEN